jgi:sec-independent protein translocase protein TatC
MIRKRARRLGRAVTAPLRWIAWPFRATREFINHEPEDSPGSDVFARTIEQPEVLLEHLEAMRRHLLRSLAVLAVTTGASFVFAERILDWLARPIGGIGVLQAIEVTEPISAFMRVALLSGFALALPYLLGELFGFLHPGLRRHERVTLLIAIPSATLLFLVGMAFAYYVMLPAALPFLLNFMGIRTAIRPASYIRFVTGIMFWVGVAFQFPLIVYALAALGVVRSRTLIDGWRLAIVGIAVLAAAVTPTVDPVNMVLVMIPMVVLYFLSIGLASIAERGRARRLRQAR